MAGPFIFPKILTGKKKLFFFTNFDRITQRSMASVPETVPDMNMNQGNFSEALAGEALLNASGNPPANPHQFELTDPQPQVTGWQGLVNPALCPNPNTPLMNGYVT